MQEEEEEKSSSVSEFDAAVEQTDHKQREIENVIWNS